MSNPLKSLSYNHNRLTLSNDSLWATTDQVASAKVVSISLKPHYSAKCQYPLCIICTRLDKIPCRWPIITIISMKGTVPRTHGNNHLSHLFVLGLRLTHSKNHLKPPQGELLEYLQRYLDMALCDRALRRTWWMPQGGVLRLSQSCTQMVPT